MNIDPSNDHKPGRGPPRVQTGDDTHSLVQERCDDSFEIVGRDAYVAVGDHEVIVTDERHHIEEVADLAADTVLRGVDGHLQIQLRELALESVHDLEGRIERVAHTEDDLPTGILLLAEGAQVLVQRRLRSAQGFEDGRRRQRHRRSHTRGTANAQGQRGGDCVPHGESRQHRPDSAEPELSSTHGREVPVARRGRGGIIMSATVHVLLTVWS